MKRVIVAEAYFDGEARRPGHVAIGVDAAGLIAEIGAADEARLSATEAEIIRCPAGTTLLPGLVDLNMKLVRWGRSPRLGWRDEPLVDTVLRCRENLSQLLAQGCTHVRDLASSWQLDLQLRDALAGGRLIGPQIAAANQPIAALGRSSRSYPVLESRSADEARGHARALLAADVDVITVSVTSGAATGGWQQLTEAEIAAVVQEAHRAGKRVAATCVGAEGAAAAAAAGVDTIDHGVSIDDRTLDAMARQGIVLVPTLRLLANFASNPDAYGVPVAARPRMAGLHDVASRTVQRAAAAGVTIATGTDRHLNETVADEIEDLVAAGLRPVEALAAATHNAARALGVDGSEGAIRTGARADLVLVRGDPTVSPRDTRNVEWVMMRGDVIHAAREGRQ